LGVELALARGIGGEREREKIDHGLADRADLASGIRLPG